MSSVSLFCQCLCLGGGYQSEAKFLNGCSMLLQCYSINFVTFTFVPVLYCTLPHHCYYFTIPAQPGSLVKDSCCCCCFLLIDKQWLGCTGCGCLPETTSYWCFPKRVQCCSPALQQEQTRVRDKHKEYHTDSTQCYPPITDQSECSPVNCLHKDDEVVWPMQDSRI